MKNLTKEEFIDRTEAVLRSEKIYISSGITKKMDLAFKIYQKVLADRDRQLVINTVSWGNRVSTLIDFDFERPKCPDCGKGLYLREINIEKGSRNIYGWKSQLICDSCLYEKYSTKTLQEAINELVPKRRAYARVQESVSRGSKEGS